MSLARVAVVLAVALAVMLAVVILRSEAVRLQHETSLLDRQADDLWQELRSREMELARLRSPVLIQARLRVAATPESDAGDSAANESGARDPDEP